MDPTSSFLGKCSTVLIGIVLSWLTVTNPDATKLANRLFGLSDATILATENANVAPISVENGIAQVPLQPPLDISQVPSLEEAEQITKISDMLQNLGATYLRVEKLSRPGEIWYRVRCDIDRGPGEVKCCLESTRDTALAAMKDVLRAVEPRKS